MSVFDSPTSAFDVALVLLAVVCLMIAAFAPMVCIAAWILAPIDRAAKSRKAPARFSMGDFLCLFVIIQIPLAAVFRLRDLETSGPLWTATVIVWILGTIIWGMGARTLSRAGVAHGSHRFVYLGLILPIAYYGMLPYTFLTCAGVVMCFDKEFKSDWTGTAFVGWLLLTVIYLLSAMFTRWMLQAARPDELPLEGILLEDISSPLVREFE